MHIKFAVIYTTDLKSLSKFVFVFVFGFREIKGFPWPVVALDFPTFASFCKACAAKK